jgi:hypothetical protein
MVRMVKRLLHEPGERDGTVLLNLVSNQPGQGEISVRTVQR